MSSIALIGSTGQVGSHILQALLQLPNSPRIHCLARRAPPNVPSPPPANLSLHINGSEQWADAMTSLSPQPEILISSLGTTRAAVGSAEAQRVIDLDLNLSVARAAHAAGTRVYVLISSTGANAKSMFAYPKMKGELEDAVKQIGFDTVVVLRPGLIMGHREEARYAESAIKMCANGLIRLFGHAATDFWAQDSDLIAKAAVVAGLKSKSGEHETLTTTPVDKSFVPLSQSDILRLGRDVWPTVTKET